MEIEEILNDLVIKYDFKNHIHNGLKCFINNNIIIGPKQLIISKVTPNNNIIVLYDRNPIIDKSELENIIINNLIGKAKFTIGEQVRILKHKRICIIDKVDHISTGFIYALNGPRIYAWYNEDQLELKV